MNSYQKMCGRILTLAALTWMGLTTVAFAQEQITTEAAAQEGLLPVQQQGEAKYVTGGIGESEKAALESIKKDYNLQITNAGPKGAYVDEVTLAIRDRSENEIVSPTDAGPLFLASLPAGTYTVEATHHDKQQKKTVTVGKSRSAKLALVWQ